MNEAIPTTASRPGIALAPGFMQRGLDDPIQTPVSRSEQAFAEMLDAFEGVIATMESSRNRSGAELAQPTWAGRS